ncbi:Thermoresistant gluconokinase [Aquimixticola soesokkakensis]|uniref:Gluconokinase n=1 Tax=Aquimixticola soesokkakensis TaxID=1519096 RepID=A0A1Y5RVL8_9RHOB|nr:gluconokinase [Aquimixticola soesokkakensis]SLN26633.1 Thermoresistant gluconokinase [Aquimixticola soesokkakensis]
MTTPTKTARRIIVMGVSGCGKSTIGQALATALGLPYLEGDDLHPPANVAAMSAGTPLTDAMRAPWLDLIRSAMSESLTRSTGVVASCSALKRSYRDQLSREGAVFFVHLALSPQEAVARMSQRPGHFMPASLAASQAQTLQALEPDEAGVTLEAVRPVADLVAQARAALDQHCLT